MTVAQFLAVFFVIFAGNVIIANVIGFEAVDETLLPMATFAVIESFLIYGVFWCFEHIRFV